MNLKSFIAYVVVFVIGFGACAGIQIYKDKKINVNGKTVAAVSSYDTADTKAGSNQVQIAAEKISEYVVNIDTVGIVMDNQSYFSMPQEQQGRASGVIISADGYILTNNHVVENANTVKVTTHDEKQYKAKIIGTDPRTDMAVIKIQANNLDFAKFADSNTVKVGEHVIAVGNALGLGTTVTSGIVSAKREQFDLNGKAFESIIQTDASINQGNSGGALADLNGNLIGINTAIASQSGGSIGIGFAVPSNTARKISEEIIKNGKITRAWLGVGMVAYNDEYRKSLVEQGVPTLPEKNGVMVAQVYDNSPAQKAGIQKGDIILAIDNVDFTAMERENEAVSKMSTIVSGKKVGQTIKIKLLSSGKEKTLNVVLGKMPEESSINQNQQLQQMPKNMRRGRGQQMMPEGIPFPFFGEP